jgi:hypothetical protein
MPYRRLPTTDKARLRALEAAIKKTADNEDNNHVISNALAEELKNVKRRFENTLTQYELDTKIQAQRNHDYKAAMEGARMYISHFIQVLYLSSERGEINSGIKYYDLKEFKGKVPPLNSEEDILKWGNKATEGEQKRIQSGGSAIYNPSIALVKIKVEEFYDATIFQSNLRRNTSRSFEKMRAIRKVANEFVSKLWTEIEENIDIEDPEIKRNIAEQYGLVYVFRRNEKQKLEAKATQRDLIFEFS